MSDKYPMLKESMITRVSLGLFSGYIWLDTLSAVYYYYLYNNMLKSRDACQANCVVKTVGGADGADDRRGRRSACRGCHVL